MLSDNGGIHRHRSWPAASFMRHQMVIIAQPWAHALPRNNKLGMALKPTFKIVFGSASFEPAVRPYVEPLMSYLRCRRISVGKTLPMTTKRTCHAGRLSARQAVHQTAEHCCMMWPQCNL